MFMLVYVCLCLLVYESVAKQALIQSKKLNAK